METDWVYLTYKVHNAMENMLVPEQRNVPRTRWRNWALYATIILYKYYTREKSSYFL